MYYEEKLIDGTWMWRGTPNGEWTPMNSAQLHRKIADIENQLGAIADHLFNCHESFRNRQHGGVAEQKLRHGVEEVLQRPYDG